MLASAAEEELREAAGLFVWVTLVTPMRISNPLLGSFAGFGVLQLVFAREPPSLALFFVGGLLALAGVRRISA